MEKIIAYNLEELSPDAFALAKKVFSAQALDKDSWGSMFKTEKHKKLMAEAELQEKEMFALIRDALDVHEPNWARYSIKLTGLKDMYNVQVMRGQSYELRVTLKESE